jgi:hypothetical protein
MSSFEAAAAAAVVLRRDGILIYLYLSCDQVSFVSYDKNISIFSRLL